MQPLRSLSRRFLAVCVLAGSPLLARAQDDPAPCIARIEAPQVPNRQGLDGYSLQQVMQRFRIPGVSVAVIKDFRIHWTKTYGVADASSGRPLDANTLFQAASISKPIAAMAGMTLVQDGKLSLDADINTILTSWRVPASDLTRDRPVTPRSLYSHTSGADDGFGFPGYDPTFPRPTLVQILNGESPSNVGKVTFARPPFQAFKYSGGGVTIMQLAVMDLTGRPFAEFMQSALLGPLEMTRSTYEQPLPAPLAPNAARAHPRGAAIASVPWHAYPEQAAAGLWTTPSDLARAIIEVQKALQGPAGRVLSQASAREMTAPVGAGDYAIGFGIERRGQGWYFGHGGSNWGFCASMIGHVRKGYGMVVMTNADCGSPMLGEFEARVAAAYGWDSLDKPVVR